MQEQAWDLFASWPVCWQAATVVALTFIVLLFTAITWARAWSALTVIVRGYPPTPPAPVVNKVVGAPVVPPCEKAQVLKKLNEAFEKIMDNPGWSVSLPRTTDNQVSSVQALLRSYTESAVRLTGVKDDKPCSPPSTTPSPVR